jgi:uncharacterized protein
MKKTERRSPLNLDYLHRKLVKTRYVYIGDAGTCGLGIFAAKAFAQGQVILGDEDGDYYHTAYTYAQIAAMGLDLAQHCFQVDHDRYLLPHGSIDDLINHACEPTTGIRLTRRGYRLLALRDIAVGQQLTYDYSTYITNPRERLQCCCGSPRCRGEIGPFRNLPPWWRAYYRERDVVGAFAVADSAGHEASHAPAAKLVRRA